jgi:ribulose-5-phosphate 4-epimerase/fuculose-1-phosphate aldolase
MQKLPGLRMHPLERISMEIYTGIKFRCTRRTGIFTFDKRLADLNTWAFILAGLGLTPLHPGGAYGNQSYRTGPTSLIITKSGMIPEKDLIPDNYIHIEGFDEKSKAFFFRGTGEPSSESILHYSLYKELPHVGAVMHGHSKLLEHYAVNLEIPVTSKFEPYGTFELAESALGLLRGRDDFILLKDHGFVAIGKDIDSTGNLVLDYYGRLISLLKK